ncbi:MAG: hypothetical protein AAF726_15995 [Planctomycetota bacterium]
MRIPVIHTVAPAILTLPAAAQAPVLPVDTLTDPGASVGDQVGQSLSLDASHLCAGAPLGDGTFSNEGLVLIWDRPSLSGSAPTELTSPMPRSSGQFGAAVELSGTDLFIGELQADVLGSPLRGAVHVYAEQGGGWMLVDSIGSPNSGPTDFGASLARDGGWLVVGEPRLSGQFNQEGAAHVYRLTSGTWQLETTLTASDPGLFARFGTDVAIDGERILVGAPQRRNGSVIEGAAYAFELIGGSWIETGRLTIEGGSGDQGFGRSVAIDGTTAVVGSGRMNQRGSAYVFEDAGPSWSQQLRLQPDSLSATAMFGSDVAIEGDALLVGCSQDNVLSTASGSGWLFERDGGSWAPSVRFVADPINRLLGDTVALDGAGTYALGEPSLWANGITTSGAIRVFEAGDVVGMNYCSAVPNSTGVAGGIAALGSNVVAEGRLELIAYDLPDNAFGFFLTSRMQGLVNQPGGSQGVLCLGGSIGRYVGAGQIRNSGVEGFFSLELDLSNTPTPTGLVQVVPGETWNFQTWHRDSVAGQATSNFTNATTIVFQ